MERTVNFLKRASAVATLCGAIAINSPAQTFTSLFAFNGTDGSVPEAPLIQATNGSLYGTTFEGGRCGGGVLFKITTSGKEKAVYCYFNVQAGPVTPVVQAFNGDFYGTTFDLGTYGQGSIYQVNAGGTQTTLYSFCAQSGCPDGNYPFAGLVYSAEELYGTTLDGGAYGGGTVFRIKTSGGTLKTIYNFCTQSGCTDGNGPTVLGLANDGNFYGITSAGGAYGKGTVFQLTSSGTLTVLYSFCAQSGCPDGSSPNSVIQAADGNFYGTTLNGGTHGGGVVFNVPASDTATTLYSFCTKSKCTDGKTPVGLIQATDGNFYGTTKKGGANGSAGGDGTIFKVTSKGKLTTLYNFCSQTQCQDGQLPYAGLVQDTNGVFYGTTYYGATEYGTVFSLSMGLEPFVAPQTTSGHVGSNVKILGTDLTGATSVTFNGTAAEFTVSSASLIIATVPAGATTGTIEVVTPGGTLKSNVPFRVTD